MKSDSSYMGDISGCSKNDYCLQPYLLDAVSYPITVDFACSLPNFDLQLTC